MARTEAGLANSVSSRPSRTLWQIFRGNVLTLFNAIVGCSFALLLLLGQWKDALFGLAALGNILIGVVQEYRAKKSLDRLSILNASLTRVVRDDTEQNIGMQDVVRDDVLLLGPGDQVPADASIIDGDGLEIDESLLTGESNPVSKGPGSEVFAGSSVVAGRGIARVIRVGADSFASSITAEAKRFSVVRSEIRESLDTILRWITWLLVPAMVLVVNGQMQASGGWEESIATGRWRAGAVGAVASVIAMIPLGLVLLTSVAFAVGGIRLARAKVLIQELAAVEGLARVDMLCLDKTGTLTEGRLVFDAIHETSASPAPGWRQVLGWFGADPQANATARCLAAAFPSGASLRPSSTAPFSSVRKWSAVSFGSDQFVAGTWVLGAPEIVLREDTPGTVHLLEAAARLASSGLRTLVLAHAPEPLPPQGRDDAQLPPGCDPICLLTFREKVRPDAARILGYFRNEGVEVRIISGDDPRTVAALAREVGLDAENGYDARKLPEDPELLLEVVENHVLFGRVTPEQKRDMVIALQRGGHTVAMTGDGVNDIPALKAADIGISMDSAAAASKAVSRLVLLDGRFDRLPGVVAEGRRVIANIERVSVLFLSKTAYAVALSVVFGALLWEFPFLPRQLSATDGLTIGIPAFFLALMPNNRRYAPGFLKRSLSFAVPFGLVIAAAVFALNVFATTVGAHTTSATRTGSVITLSFTGLWALAAISRPLNLGRAAVIGAMYLGLVFVLTVPFLQDFFSLEWPPNDLLFAALGSGLGGILAIEALHQFLGRRNARKKPLTARETSSRSAP
ncbi:HAD-IC family P-type ATPase [Arthrobacter bambusae]|uniref:HAD-IC family P-type ATPase n=1 Tax=Arthrobacter bambusae TaxID=1338426 RepID=UPI0027840A39|nr:HAD-IC family P-type ATPase [Arthrobacter bambusae]MDQ0028680.1 cation-transporting ATPase E [Arthrobacter bambusae]MDQ0096526.1 cation-transporting ATPase E [Arthrobacter bambusae]